MNSVKGIWSQELMSRPSCRHRHSTKITKVPIVDAVTTHVTIPAIQVHQVTLVIASKVLPMMPIRLAFSAAIVFAHPLGRVRAKEVVVVCGRIKERLPPAPAHLAHTASLSSGPMVPTPATKEID